MAGLSYSTPQKSEETRGNAITQPRSHPIPKFYIFLMGWSHKTIKYTAPLQQSFSIIRIYRKKICRGFVYLIVLRDHPSLVSVLFAVLLSLHLVTFLNVFYYLFMPFFQHQAHAWADVCHHTAAEVCHRQLLIIIYGQLTQALAILAVLAEESRTQASFQTLSQPFSGWMTKPDLPV